MACSAAEIWSSLCRGVWEDERGFSLSRARNRLNSCKSMSMVETSGLASTTCPSCVETLWNLGQESAMKSVGFCRILRSSFPVSWTFFLVTLVTVDDPIVLVSCLLAFADLRGQSSMPALSTSPATLVEDGATNTAPSGFTGGEGVCR
jgi:hypothetical protein